MSLASAFNKSHLLKHFSGVFFLFLLVVSPFLLFVVSLFLLLVGSLFLLVVSLFLMGMRVENHNESDEVGYLTMFHINHSTSLQAEAIRFCHEQESFLRFLPYS